MDDNEEKPTLALYFDNDTMDEVSAAKAIHILSQFLDVKLEIVDEATGSADRQERLGER